MAGILYYESLAALCRKSYFQFVKSFWNEIVEEEPEWNWHIPYLCDEIQKVLERVIAGQPKKHDLIINVSPGESKSTITSIMITPWLWTRMPHARTINGSYQFDLSLEMSRKARDIIQSEKYRKCFPAIEIRKDQNTKGNYVTTRKGQRISTSTGAGITGKHAHVIIVDDPLDPNEAASDAELKMANSWMSGTLASRKVSKSKTPTIIVMQRLHQDDPTGNRLRNAELSDGKDRVKHICIPASDEFKIKPSKLKAKYVDGIMNPLRTGKEVIEEIKAQSGSIVYACQYGQDPKPAGGGMFKRDRIKIEKVAPDKSQFKQIVRYWDKAGTLDGGDWTVGVKIGEQLIRAPGTKKKIIGRLFWILDVVRFREDATQRERIILNTARADGPDVTVVIEEENGSGGKESAQNTVTNLAGFKVKRDKPVGDKALRADPASDQWNSYNFRLLEGPWNATYLDEMEYFPYSTYKDQGDGTSGGFAYLTRPRVRIGCF
jgi:hypothetical protein